MASPAIRTTCCIAGGGSARIFEQLPLLRRIPVGMGVRLAHLWSPQIMAK